MIELVDSQDMKVYSAPTATFVPVKVEERLLSCMKSMLPNGGWCIFGSSGS